MREQEALSILAVFDDVPDRDLQSAAPSITFIGEPAIGDGVFREFVGTSLTTMFAAPENIDLWAFCEGTGTWAPSPSRGGGGGSHYVYEVTGWLMALALRKRVKMPAMVHPLFMLQLAHADANPLSAGRADVFNTCFWTTDRMRAYSPVLADSFAELRNMSDKQLGEFTFVGDVLDADTGRPRSMPLWSDVAADTIVTRDNLETYISGRVRFELWGGGKERAWQGILKGFTRIIPVALMQGVDFSLHTDETLAEYCCGQRECMADVGRFERAVTYVQGAQDKSHPVMVWFWELVRTWPDATRRMLLKFWTSSHYVDIYSVNQNQPLTLGVQSPMNDDDDDNANNQVAAVHDDDGRMPTAATCFRKMLLPPCSSKQTLERQLLTAFTHHNQGLGNI